MGKPIGPSTKKTAGIVFVTIMSVILVPFMK